MNRLYFDNNATTPVASEVLEAMWPCYREAFGNPSSVHRFGREAKTILDQARQQVAGLIGAEPNEVVFTSGGTEANNLALRGLVEASPKSRKHLITTEIEHHAVLHPCRTLQKMGIEVTLLKVDGKGRVDPDDVRRAIEPDTILISVMMANNEVGTLQPLQEIGELAREHDTFFHTDAIQAVGKIPVNVTALGVDLLSLSGHKFHAPKGIGALYIRKGTPLLPLLTGGGHERNRRAGTENVPHIAGLGVAAEIAGKFMNDGHLEIARLRDSFERQVMAQIPGVSINGDSAHRLPNTSNLRFVDVESEALVINLDLCGVACSTGSACTSGSIEPSHVLIAMGLATEAAFQSIRFSLSRYTTPEEVEAVVHLLPSLVRRLRLMTPQGAARY